MHAAQVDAALCTSVSTIDDVHKFHDVLRMSSTDVHTQAYHRRSYASVPQTFVSELFAVFFSKVLSFLGIQPPELRLHV